MSPLPFHARPGDEDGFDELSPEWLAAKPGLKWGTVPAGTIPAWVADMDFPAPAVVRRALVELADIGDLGYAHGYPAKRLARAFYPRVRARFSWEAAPDRLRAFTDLVQAAQALLHVGTSPGDGVLLLTPSYPPFVNSIEAMRRRLLPVPLARAGNSYELDIDAARHLAPSASALLLVNPHNPTGRVLSRSELAALAELAQRHDLLVVSDEIHADLILQPGVAHTPFASLDADAAARTVTLYSASKSFNLGGMCCAVAHVGHDGVRSALDALPDHLLGNVGTAAVATTLAAWSHEGDLWLDRCLDRLRANREILGEWLAGAGGSAGVHGALPEATYLAWLDLRDSGLGDDPTKWLVEHARARLSRGLDFGPGGAGHARLNFATTPAVLGETLDRVARAIEDRRASRH